MNRRLASALLGVVTVAALGWGLAFFVLPGLFGPWQYQAPVGVPSVAGAADSAAAVTPSPRVSHLPTPEPLKAIYMTACIVGAPALRDNLVKLIEETELNSVVIDIKDYSGTIAFRTGNPLFADVELTRCGATDLAEFITALHRRGIYVIGRIAAFQDPAYTRKYPELAIKKRSDGTVWKDYKGLSFVDVASREYWDYLVALGRAAYGLGFDELNFDYVRYPSDGDMRDIQVATTVGHNKAEVLERFFQYLSSALRPTGAVLSVDLFGMTTTNTDDLNIGQVLERALPYFDYVAPMVYPSHYPRGFNGWSNPNHYVYEVVKFSLDRASHRAEATTTSVAALAETPVVVTVTDASTTSQTTAVVNAALSPTLFQKAFYPRSRLRPWLQDFDYGGDYGPAEVRAQIQAAYDAGLTSWMLWSPANEYTRAALGSAS